MIAELAELRAAVEDDAPKPGASKESVLTVISSPALRKPLVTGVMLMVFQQFSGVNAVNFYSGADSIHISLYYAILTFYI